MMTGRRASAVGFIGAMCLLMVHGSAVRGSDDARPNVLMIIVDDMNDWVGALNGHPDVRTPNLDRLAREGMLFTNAHVAAPVCNPSRVATLTGRQPSSTGIYDNSVRWHEAMPEAVTLPQHFKQGGYRVYGGGKVHHHTPGNNRAGDWHEYFDQVFDSHAQQHVYAHGSYKDFAWPEGFPLSGIPEVAALRKPPQNPREFDWGPFDQEDHEMGDGQMVAWASGILREPPAEPFFLAAGIYMPHLPWYAPREYFDWYPVDQVAHPPIKSNDLDDIPAGGQKMAADRRGDLELVRARGKYNAVLQAYLACISYADALVGDLLRALESGPAAANTIVVFWSDHGWHFGEKEHLHKFTLWERSTRIPFVVKAPGVTVPGSRSAEPASTVDLFPTLIELCGLAPLPWLDGVSLVAQLSDPDVARERPALTTHGWGNHALRTRDWRYIRYADGGEELYDHRSDPHEWTNLATDSRFSEVKNTLRAWLPKSDAQARSAN